MLSLNDNIGRLKRTLKNKCEDCGKHLQLRVKVENGREIEYERCPICGFESKPIHVSDLPNIFRAGEFAE